MDLISAVEELSGLASTEMNTILKDSENFTIQCSSGTGPSRQIDVERLASSLPLHLIAVLLSPDVEMHLGHLLRGVRLMHILCDLAPRHTRLEQILLDDVKVSEQIIDLVFFMLVVLARYEQGRHFGHSIPFVHSALVACTLHLLPGYISTQWHDLVHVLLAHPKVDIFMDIAYDAVHVDIRFLHVKLLALNNDISCNKSGHVAAERTVHYLCQQCEASLQFLLSLCQQKLFRDRLLKNKELCKNGAILSLTRSTLRLSIPDWFKESIDIISAVSRIKAKVLSVLLQLCEAENISYLDEVAGSSKSMSLAKFVALDILHLLKYEFRRETKRLSYSPDRSNPKGLVLLNLLRLADIFSDDSNFRSFFMANIIEVLVEILVIPHEDFLSSWCSVDISKPEEDANVEYDPYTAAGAALISFAGACESTLPVTILQNETNSACPSVFNGISSVTYEQQRTSYLVKVVANLHCFVPNYCEEEEKNLFARQFRECLLAGNTESFSRYPLNYVALRDATICKNLSALLNHAASLVPSLLNDDDVNLLRQFLDQIQHNLTPQLNGVDLVAEPLFKDVKGETKYELEDQHSLHPSSNSLNPNFNKMLQDAQNTSGGPCGLSVYGQDPNAKCYDVDIQKEIQGSSLFEDSDQFIVKGKEKEPPDYVQPNQSGMEDTLLANGSSSGSSRGIVKDPVNLETTGREQNSLGDIDLVSDVADVLKNPDYANEFQEDDKTETVQGDEKQPRKRKRTIMDDKQIILIEKVLLEEPELHRNSILLQSWAEKLSALGSEITASQLKNWLNNRKSRLARAAREARAPSEGESAYPDKSGGLNISQYYDSPDSAGEEYYITSSRASTQQCGPKAGGVLTRSASAADHEMIPRSDFVDYALQHNIHMSRPPSRLPFEPEQKVSLYDEEWKEVGKAKVFQVRGGWHEQSLDDGKICIVDVTELKVEKWMVVQHPSEAAGTTFEEAAARNGGIMRVAWDASKVLLSP